MGIALPALLINKIVHDWSNPFMLKPEFRLKSLRGQDRRIIQIKRFEMPRTTDNGNQIWLEIQSGHIQ